MLIFCRTMKLWRVTAILQAAKITSWTPNTYRATYKSSLALSPVIVHMLNCLVIPQPPTPPLRALLEGSAFLDVPGAENQHDFIMGQGAGRTEAAISARGLYFLAGIAEEQVEDEDAEPHTTWRVAGLHAFSRTHFISEETLAKLFSTQTYSELASLLRVSTHKTKLLGNTTTVTGGECFRGRHTLMAKYLQKRPMPDNLNLGLNAQDVRIRQPYALRGRDIHINIDMPNREDDLIIPGDADQTIQYLLMQVASDFLVKFPVRKTSRPYATLTMEQREGAPIETYRQAVLPSDCARVASVSRNQWDNLTLHFFPDKGFVPPPNSKGLPCTTFFQVWVALINRLTDDRVALVRAVIQRELRTWKWLPYSDNTVLWPTKSIPDCKYRTIPDDHHGPAPLFAANPYIFTTFARLRRFELR